MARFPKPDKSTPVLEVDGKSLSQLWFDFLGYIDGQIQSIFGTISAWSSAWATWTPTFSMTVTGGTPITAAVSGTGARFIQKGKTVHFSLDATISNIGVGNSGNFLFTLPVAGFNASLILGAAGVEIATSGRSLQVFSSDATHGAIRYTDASSIVTTGNGTRVQLGGSFEAA